MSAEHPVFAGTRPRTRRAFYEYVRARGLATKGDLANDLGLSAPTVSKYLRAFVGAGLLASKTKLASGTDGGRSPVAYACVPDARVAVGVDITKTRIRTVVIDLERSVLASRLARREFDRSAAYREFVGSEVAAAVAESGMPADRVLGVGIAVPGLIDKQTGEVVFGLVIDNRGMTIRDFAPYVPYRMRLIHDSAAAGLAEFWHEQELANAFYISLGPSVGGSILINGQVYEGDRDVAGEIGHMQVHPDGLTCYCGRRGCLDPYANSTVLSQHRGGDGTLEGFFGGLDADAPGFAETWDSYTTSLARAVHNIRVLFGCPIILGGEMGPFIAEHLPTLCDKVDGFSFRVDPARDFLLPCHFRTHSVATGAGLFLIDDFRQDPGRLLESTRPSS